MKNSRRNFLKLLAAGSAAIAARPAASLAATATDRPRAAGSGAAPASGQAPPPALRAEIERQKRDLDKALRILRDHPLDPGSDPAFAFTPDPRSVVRPPARTPRAARPR